MSKRSIFQNKVHDHDFVHKNHIFKLHYKQNYFPLFNGMKSLNFRLSMINTPETNFRKIFGICSGSVDVVFLFDGKSQFVEVNAQKSSCERCFNSVLLIDSGNNTLFNA